ncbi:hypothetical protein [Streptomyces sp. NPDC088789]|uniref:hypothetical protein n=1 Tax=Streptomyces sp. NPDC088789 TaxID=3365899 RepID=UPI003818F1E0
MGSRAWWSTTAVVLGGLLATGCGGDGGRPAMLPPGSRSPTASNASSLELLLRLGVDDKVIGTGFPPAREPCPPNWMRGLRRSKVSVVRQAIGDPPENERPAYFFFDFDAGTKQPVVVCNRQIANAVITQAGGRNAFADSPWRRRR